MKYSLFLIFFVLLFSCNGQHNSSVNDSLFVDTNQIPKPQTKKYPDSTQNKVIGDIQFGINKKTFDELSNVYQKTHLKNKRYHLGNFQYLLINSKFFHEKLYQVSLYNPWVETEDDLKQTIKGAYDIVTAQYGKPDSTHNGVIDKGTDEDLFVWHIGRKRIKIISGYSFNMFTVTLQFEDVSMIAELQTESHKRQDSLTRQSKKDI